MGAFRVLEISKPTEEDAAVLAPVLNLISLIEPRVGAADCGYFTDVLMGHVLPFFNQTVSYIPYAPLAQLMGSPDVTPEKSTLVHFENAPMVAGIAKNDNDGDDYMGIVVLSDAKVILCVTPDNEFSPDLITTKNLEGLRRVVTFLAGEPATGDLLDEYKVVSVNVPDEVCNHGTSKENMAWTCGILIHFLSYLCAEHQKGKTLGLPHHHLADGTYDFNALSPTYHITMDERDASTIRCGMTRLVLESMEFSEFKSIPHTDPDYMAKLSAMPPAGQASYIRDFLNTKYPKPEGGYSLISEGGLPLEMMDAYRKYDEASSPEEKAEVTNGLSTSKLAILFLVVVSMARMKTHAHVEGDVTHTLELHENLRDIFYAVTDNNVPISSDWDYSPASCKAHVLATDIPSGSEGGSHHSDAARSEEADDY
jgi:hypothetical protein